MSLLCPAVLTTHKLGLPNGAFAQCNITSRTNYSQGNAMCAKLSFKAQTGAIQDKIYHVLTRGFFGNCQEYHDVLAL